jgi:hypothetical protein
MDVLEILAIVGLGAEVFVCAGFFLAFKHWYDQRMERLNREAWLQADRGFMNMIVKIAKGD